MDHYTELTAELAAHGALVSRKTAKMVYLMWYFRAELNATLTFVCGEMARKGALAIVNSWE